MTIKLWTRVALREDKDRKGLVCGIQKSLYDKSEPTRYWVLWRDLKKTDHEINQLEIRQ